MFPRPPLAQSSRFIGGVQGLRRAGTPSRRSSWCDPRTAGGEVDGDGVIGERLQRDDSPEGRAGKDRGEVDHAHFAASGEGADAQRGGCPWQIDPPSFVREAAAPAVRLEMQLAGGYFREK